jgi:hypothetical protein
MQRARWIHGPVADTALAFLWVPFALVAHGMENHHEVLIRYVGLVFLLSFAHQPLTLGLVYGDPVQRDARRRLYTLAPLALFGLVILGINISLVTVAIVAGLWNAEHTLMQRYGLTRIYGRKAGDDQGAVEKRMIIGWLATAAVALAAFVDLPHLVDKIGMGGTNARGVALLHDLQPLARWLVVPAVILVGRVMVQWFRAERRLGEQANPAKHLYLVATLALIVTVLVDPIAGFVGYVAGHALEYFVIVNRSLAHRAADDTSAVAVVTRTGARRAVTYATYFGLIATVVVVTTTHFDGQLYRFAILFFGGLHILYDGFIWKLRRPSVATTLGVPTVAVAASG